MSDIRPQDEQGTGPTPGLLPRVAAQAVERALEVHPVVGVMGARQTGKSTLVRAHPALKDHLYVTLDDLDVLEEARRRPDDLLGRAPRMTIDEIQRDPGLVLALKRMVDADRPRVPGRFVVTGSANLLLHQRISESLAGRAGYVPLWPLAPAERMGYGRTGIWSDLLGAPVEDWRDLLDARDVATADWRRAVRVGGFPTPAHELSDDRARRTWMQGYVQTYLERDLQNLAQIDRLVDYRRLMRAMALRDGTVVNQSEVARDVGIPRPTVHRYLDLLETSCLLVRIEAYAVNRTKRLIKSPKRFWCDTALALHLEGGSGKERGVHLEGLVLADLLAWRDSLPDQAEILHWRTTEQQEVDFVVEFGERLLPVEVKATARLRRGDVDSLRSFRDQYGEAAPGGLLLHDGEETYWASKGILSAPWWRVL